MKHSPSIPATPFRAPPITVRPSRLRRVSLALLLGLAWLIGAPGTLRAQQTGSTDLYVPDYNDAIFYRVPASEDPLVFGSNLDLPRCVAIDSKGNVYLGNSGTNDVYKYDANDDQTIYAGAFNAVFGLVFDQDDNLYVGTNASDNQSTIIVKITPAQVRTTFATGLNVARGLAIDPAGNLYVASFQDGAIYKYTPAGAKSTFATGLNTPIGIAINAAGTLFVAVDGAVDRILGDGTVSQFSADVVDPRYLAFDPQGYLYVTDTGDDTGDAGQGMIWKFNNTGGRTTYVNSLEFPLGIAVTGPPFITSAATATVAEGLSYAYQIVANGRPTSFSAKDPPPTLAINPATGLISGTPQTPGTYTLSFTANNLYGSDTQTLTLTVNAAAPVISSATTASGTVGTAFSYQIVATNHPTSYGAQNLPAGVGVTAH